MIRVEGSYLYIGGFKAEDLVLKFGTPLYVYDKEVIIENYVRLRNSLKYGDVEVLYSCKANSNVEVLKVFKELGAGLDAVSVWEALLGVKVGFPPDKILFTGNNVTEEELKLALDLGVIVNVDSIQQLVRYGRLNPEGEVSIRVNPGVGVGHHQKAVTGGVTKFGIYLNQVNEALRVAREYRLKIVGLHAHIGSGILDVEPILNVAKTLTKLALSLNLPDLKFVDVGGGLGIPYRPGDKPLDVEGLGVGLTDLFNEFSHAYGRRVKLFVEPGRYLVGNAGVLLTKVVDVKVFEDGSLKKVFVGTDTGMNHLIRPALYDSYHEVIPASKANVERKLLADVVGNICESGDVIARDRLLPELREGDILAIMDVGAYGYSMSSNYNLRPRPAEVMVYRDEVKLIRRRETFEDLIRHMILD
ncbi:MAG: diaminopimelate decarboxylase [Zestosphaera tikiterensis]|uniref:Diaminopimelate decarboxylase n=1 Tax=Zestosphaera tikiterensis TaxID=1973259 RepID=A0A2R7Y2S2_9CREN|nr:MAG: diaminopimelate decarboxylase [Zestosphaera tikiterensis]